jgi:hypothetical protein
MFCVFTHFTFSHISHCHAFRIFGYLAHFAIPHISHFTYSHISRILHCRDSILYRLVLAYFTAHDNWASQHNITIMCRAIPHIMRSFPAIMHQIHDTFLHLCNAFPHSRLAHIHCASSHSIAHLHVPLRIFAFHHASSRFIVHLRISSRIFAFHHASSCSIAI